MEVKETIVNLLKDIPREGIPELISFLENSSFFEDPASANGYNSYKGGLAEHSLTVYNNLNKFKEINFKDSDNLNDSIKIIGLLHDISYAGIFHESFKNVPLKDKDGKNKVDERGKIVFIEKKQYEINTDLQLPYPHGSLSNSIIKKYIKLSKLEDLAIFWQQGPYGTNNYGLLQKAFKIHKLIWYTYLADQEALLYSGDLK